MPIVSGKVSFGRVRKDDDFGIKREAHAELSFTCEGDAEAVKLLNTAGAQVVDKVHELIQLKQDGTQRPSVETKNKSAEADSTAIVANDKAKLAAAAQAKAEAPKKERAKKAPPPSAEDVEEPDAGEVETVEDVEDVELEAEPITDAALSEAVAKRNQDIKSPGTIRTLITKYSGDTKPPITTRTIPQEKRAEFLKELAVLKAG